MAVHRSMIKSATSETETPLMKQYNTFKAKYPDAVLLFRVGDFYETFGEDAKRASAVLGIVLTRRSNGKASECGAGWFSAPFARYLFAQTGTGGVARGRVRPVGRPQNGQGHC